MNSNLGNLPVISCVRQEDRTELGDLVRKDGIRLFELDGDTIVDAETFFAQAVRVLPSDPPLSGRPNWDAFVDSVWEGLSNVPERKVAVFWTHAERMLQSGLYDLLKAVDSFYVLSRSLANPGTQERPVHLWLVLLGTGPNFRPLNSYSVLR